MEIVLYKQKPITSRIKLLEKKLGGKWVYDNRMRQWHCDDGRCVRYTAPPVDEFDNICGAPDCWIDYADKPTERFSFYDL